MAKDKKWIDCPLCGTKGSMVFHKDISRTYKSKNIKPFEVAGLKGYFCNNCKDGFFTQISMNKIRAEMAYHKAKYLSSTVTLSDLVPSNEIADVLGVSKQRVSIMLKEGLIKYAMNDYGVKLPLKSELERLKKENFR
ncbi:MAG: hypothetical protein H7A23_19920 [Leptospiraceae bacterium]|nr:hypothetical protein [Leptospiraceae bacterium]MCP5496825.1 hypothetical protein [Leptospiraceae bacterium]